MEVDKEAVQNFRSGFRALTPDYCRLLDVCMGRSKTDPVNEALSDDALMWKDMRNLRNMVQVELFESMKVAMDGTEDSSEKAEPHVFDIFLMQTTFRQVTNNRRHRHLALYIPVNRNEFAWYDGEVTIYSSKKVSPKWRVTSLSGAARTLLALSESHDLKGMAMARQGLVDAVELGEDEEDAFPDITSNMNESQRRAVATVVSPCFQKGFFAIQGPPGCGKTTTCVGMIKAILQKRAFERDSKKKSILVTAPSNAAVANIALKLHRNYCEANELLYQRELAKETANQSAANTFKVLAHEAIKFYQDYSGADARHTRTRAKETAKQCAAAVFEDIIVFGDNCDTAVQFLNPRIRGVRYSELSFKLEKECEQKPERSDALRADFVKSVVKWLHLNPDLDWTFPELARICPFIDMDSPSLRAFFGSLLADAKVIFSTLNSSGSNQLRRNISLDTMFLDEGGQCPEAEFYIAATFPGAKRIVVVGDPKQLPATVIDPSCKECGYGESWLGNVFRLQPEKVHLLSTQYRMDPAILELPNRLFYANRIQSGDNVYSRSITVERPFMFLDMNRKGREEQSGFSWTNIYEITVIKALLFSDNDIVRMRNNSTNAPVRIIIITPYKAQATLMIQKIPAPPNSILTVATVDSFQGQEADIVILSTVRTHRPGFVDDSQRLNVALTRAKRILRVVGDAYFFLSLGQRSTLRQLAEHAKKKNVCDKSTLQSVPWSRPNWDHTSFWKPCMTSRFHDCLNKLPDRKKNMALNTLQAIVMCDEKALHAPIPHRQHASWYISGLKGYCNEVRVVWIAKTGHPPVVEAIFAGKGRDCRRFVQMNSLPPINDCIVLPGLRGAKEASTAAGDIEDRPGAMVSWRVTNDVQQIVVKEGALPASGLQLDVEQETVARSSPPLLIESRSGTGKTLVLLQHAAYYADNEDERSNCFVTVSPRLKIELEKQHHEMDKASNGGLKPTLFFSFRELLLQLLEIKNISDFDDMSPCTYLGFNSSKTSFEETKVEPHLTESEIGGVICGSLAAAEDRSFLSRSNYLSSKRSNIGRESDQDTDVREYIYDEYEKYSRWKRDSRMYDQSDVVMRLLQEDWPQYFSSAYLDEIQDLTYACIFLLCNIGGKDSLQWICAGDPAQMISPGCSFHFDGLKQTLLSVRSGIEASLSSVSQLLVNYRTTKDVLDLANKVLGVARDTFPDSIPFARTEVANKDLGLRVVLCDWDVACRENIDLGTNQACVFSSANPAMLEKEAKNWLGSQPFIMSSLDSKGLEFDDVIVAFDYDRKVWRVCDKRVASLRMLRELYVAVTRARQRVVVLVKKGVPEMASFFESLNCDFQTTHSHLVLRDFTRVTSAGDWLERAKDFFEGENFRMAARCFDFAKDDGWCRWSQGKDFSMTGNYASAAEEYLAALQIFGLKKDHDLVLQVGLALADRGVSKNVSWDTKNSPFLKEALLVRSESLTRRNRIRIALLGILWEEVMVSDLKDESLTHLFSGYRGNAHFKAKIAETTKEELNAIERVLPLAVADCHCDQARYADSVRVFLFVGDQRGAINATTKALHDVRIGSGVESLPNVVTAWARSGVSSQDPVICTLLKLFQSVEKAASAIAKDALRYLGREIIIAAVDADENVDRLLLHTFSPADFFLEVSAVLENKFKRQHVQVVRWYIEKNDMSSALDFAQKKLKVFKDQHLWELLELLKKLPSWLFDRLKQLRLLFPFAVEFLSSVLIDMERKKQFARSLAGFLGEDWDSPDDFQLLGSAMLFLLDRIATGKNTPTRKQETLGFATLFAVG